MSHGARPLAARPVLGKSPIPLCLVPKIQLGTEKNGVYGQVPRRSVSASRVRPSLNTQQIRPDPDELQSISGYIRPLIKGRFGLSNML